MSCAPIEEKSFQFFERCVVCSGDVWPGIFGPWGFVSPSLSRASAFSPPSQTPKLREIQPARITRGFIAEEMAVQQLPQNAGMRKNGKQWHEPRKAFRPAAGQTAYAKRVARESQAAEVKKIENEMKAEKEEERQRRIQGIKDKRAAKEEKERYEKMAEKMHKKRVERLKRREKRNKLLKS